MEDLRLEQQGFEPSMPWHPHLQEDEFAGAAASPSMSTRLTQRFEEA